MHQWEGPISRPFEEGRGEAAVADHNQVIDDREAVPGADCSDGPEGPILASEALRAPYVVSLVRRNHPLVRCPDKVLSHPRPLFVRRFRQVGLSMMRWLFSDAGLEFLRRCVSGRSRLRNLTRGSTTRERASGPTPSCSDPGVVELCVDVTQFVGVSAVRILAPLPFPERPVPDRGDRTGRPFLRLRRCCRVHPAARSAGPPGCTKSGGGVRCAH